MHGAPEALEGLCWRTLFSAVQLPGLLTPKLQRLSPVVLPEAGPESWSWLSRWADRCGPLKLPLHSGLSLPRMRSVKPDPNPLQHEQGTLGGTRVTPMGSSWTVLSARLLPLKRPEDMLNATWEMMQFYEDFLGLLSSRIFELVDVCCVLPATFY